MMTANKIIKADFLDLLFDNRNKLYGAYMLRKTYKKRLWTALAVTLFTIMIALWIFQPAAVETERKIVHTRELVLAHVEEIKPPPAPPPVKEEAPASRQLKNTSAAAPEMATPQIQKTKFTPPVIKKDKEVQKTDMPLVNEISIVDLVTTDGIKTDVLAANIPVINTTEGTGHVKGVVQEVERKKEDANKIFEKVEIEASVNIARWRSHLEKNLVNYINDAVYAGMQSGTYTVMVHFVVETDGTIAQVRALNNPGYGLGEGAVQVVKSGPKWNPGQQNGRKVRSYHTQPVSFIIVEG